MRKIAFILIVFISLIFSGCASDQGSIDYFIKPKSASKIKRVAVLPFMNLTTDKFAGERARDFVITALLEKGIDVVPKGAVDREVKRLGVPAGFFFDVNDLRVLADVLKVDGFVQGSVDEYKIERRGTYSYPVVAVTLKVLDKDGNVVWQASGVKSYYSTLGRLLGLKSKDPIVALKDFVYELLGTFHPEYVGKVRIKEETVESKQEAALVQPKPTASQTNSTAVEK